jgi:hypothetical protein
MKYLTLAVLLTVMQASPPVPRKTANTTASSSQHVKQNAENNQSPTQVQSPIQNKDAPQDQDKDHNPADAEVKQNIVIRECAPAPKPGTDNWYHAYVVFTGALVVIGAIGAGYAVKTLRAIERQAKANEDQLTEIQQSAEKTDRMIYLTAQQAENSRAATEAAKESADAAKASVIQTKASVDAVVSSERAWVVPEVQWFRKGRTKTAGNNTELLVSLICKNYGRVPAWITDTRVRAIVVRGLIPSEPDTPDNAWEQLPSYRLLIPNDPTEYSVLWRPLADGWAEPADFTLIYGFVRYRDIFGPGKESWFGYTVSDEGGGLWPIPLHEYHRFK